VKILGLSNAWDAGAALVVDGQIVAAANEERFTRIKLDRCFPEQAIRYVLSVGGLEIDQIDFVASGCWKGVDQDVTAPRLISDTADQIQEADDPERTTEIITQRLEVSSRRDQEFRDELLLCLSRYGVEESRIRFFDHHFTHAVSAWSPLGSTRH
jgi:carbamoyltransferase